MRFRFAEGRGAHVGRNAIGSLWLESAALHVHRLDPLLPPR
jgi:hypothetical protein